MKKKLCVIMSLYEYDKLQYLQLAIESVLNQTFKDFDCFIQLQYKKDVRIAFIIVCIYMLANCIGNLLKNYPDF